jgi:hypothetical protein
MGHACSLNLRNFSSVNLLRALRMMASRCVMSRMRMEREQEGSTHTPLLQTRYRSSSAASRHVPTYVAPRACLRDGALLLTFWLRDIETVFVFLAWRAPVGRRVGAWRGCNTLTGGRLGMTSMSRLNCGVWQNMCSNPRGATGAGLDGGLSFRKSANV